MPVKEWEFVGQGTDHKVYRSPYNSHRFMKIPGFFNTLAIMLTGMNAAHIQAELAYSEQLVEGSNIKIPETRIVARRFDYIMFQDEVVEDGSIGDMGRFIASQKIELLIDKYDQDPKNFVCNGGFVYWVDPTKGRFSRTLDRWQIISSEKYTHLKANLRKFRRNKLRLNF